MGEITMPDRRFYIGGSDAAAIIGVSPWSTPVELWLQKTGREQPRPVDPVREKIFKRGKMLEPVILEMVIDKLKERGHDVELLETNERYYDPEHKFMSCEIDFELLLDGEHINGDCKSVVGFARRKWGDEDTEDVPIEYAAQFMHGLMITGRRRCLVAALIGLDDVAIYWVTRDDETIAAMRAKEIAFWNDHVLGDTPPDTFTYDDVKLLFPSDNGLTIAATDEVFEAVEELKRVKHQISSAQAREAMLQHKIADFINPFAILQFHGKDIATWKGQNDTRMEMDKFKEEQSALFNQYARTRTVRVLRLKK